MFLRFSEDVLGIIVLHLDVSTHCNLALTCKKLRKTLPYLCEVRHLDQIMRCPVHIKDFHVDYQGWDHDRLHFTLHGGDKVRVVCNICQNKSLVVVVYICNLIFACFMQDSFSCSFLNADSGLKLSPFGRIDQFNSLRVMDHLTNRNRRKLANVQAVVPHKRSRTGTYQ